MRIPVPTILENRPVGGGRATVQKSRFGQLHHPRTDPRDRRPLLVRPAEERGQLRVALALELQIATTRRDDDQVRTVDTLNGMLGLQRQGHEGGRSSPSQGRSLDVELSLTFYTLQVLPQMSRASENLHGSYRSRGQSALDHYNDRINHRIEQAYGTIPPPDCRSSHFSALPPTPILRTVDHPFSQTG